MFVLRAVSHSYTLYALHGATDRRNGTFCSGNAYLYVQYLVLFFSVFRGHQTKRWFERLRDSNLKSPHTAIAIGMCILRLSLSTLLQTIAHDRRNVGYLMFQFSKVFFSISHYDLHSVSHFINTAISLSIIINWLTIPSFSLIISLNHWLVIWLITFTTWMIENNNISLPKLIELSPCRALFAPYISALLICVLL